MARETKKQRGIRLAATELSEMVGEFELKRLSEEWIYIYVVSILEEIGVDTDDIIEMLEFINSKDSNEQAINLKRKWGY